MSDDAPQCGRCRHWARLDPGDLRDGDRGLLTDDDGAVVAGRCRGRPPRVVGELLPAARRGRDGGVLASAGDLLWASVWPLTFQGDACGEFAAGGEG